MTIDINMREHNKNKIKDAALVFLIILFIVFPVSTLVSALISQQLWEWFIEPTFKIPVPSVWAMLGLLLTVTYYFHIDQIAKEVTELDKKNLWRALGQVINKMLTRWVFVLALGFIYHSFSS